METTNTNVVGKVLDFRGEECPGPLIKTAKELSKAGVREKLIILTTSKLCVEMIRETVQALGIGSINIVERDKHYEIVVVKEIELRVDE